MGKNFQHEIKNFLIIFVYLWVILALLALHKNFLVYQAPFAGQLMALFNAFVLGKVILILEHFRIGEIFHARPPIYRVFIKAVIFSAFLFTFHVLEEGVRGWFHGKDFMHTIEEISSGRLAALMTLAAIMFVSLTPYLLLRELTRIIGERELFKMIFHPPRTPRAS